MSFKKILFSILSTMMTFCFANAAQAQSMAETTQKGMEKCYGIAKAEMNDCGTAKQSCAGESKIDRDPASWLFVPTGLCNRIAGGSTTPPKG